MIRSCFRPVTARNKSVMVDFDRRRLLPGSISLIVAREEEALREKEEERESTQRKGRIGRTLMRRRHLWPLPRSSPKAGDVCNLRRLRRTLQMRRRPHSTPCLRQQGEEEEATSSRQHTPPFIYI
ncbi:hypothetical protein BHM03_00003330 [Ensete ventricosum]|nr:hypothetical protein BHM03_00003330 [Ensete ventricosum]